MASRPFAHIRCRHRVGGSALALLGVISRPTRDVDVLYPILSDEILHSAKEFALNQRNQGLDLADDWLNNGPIQLADILPRHWHERVQSIFRGSVLHVMVLAREDLLKTKLFALCDRGTDLADCLALAPNEDEIAQAESWLVTQDAHPMWPDHVRNTLAHVTQRLSDGL